jgi:hypothetical protein
VTYNVHKISQTREKKRKRENNSEDISELLKSFGKALHDTQLDESLLKKYVSDVSTENLQELVAKSFAIQS